MKRYWLIGLLLLCAGCTATVEHDFLFADGAHEQCFSAESRTSFLNEQNITACEPSKATLQTTVSTGTSTGQAMMNTAQAASLLGMGALIGTGTNSVNAVVTAK